MKKLSKHILVLFLIVLFSACGTYNTKSSKFQSQIQQNDLNGALTGLENNKFLKKRANKLLYLLEKGRIAYLQNDHKLSNDLFNQADVLVEDNSGNTGNEILGTLVNAQMSNYKGEDFEKVAIHYHKALNYLFLKRYDEALVEAKRISLQLQKINDKYPADKKNRYKDDAFSHILQGMLYEVSGDFNNAFIAYRNAANLYLEANGNYIGVNTPQQLVEDLLHTASVMGFTAELERYEEKFQTKYNSKNKAEGGELILFWENGLVPYKDETFFTFSILPGNKAGYFTIVNKDLGLDLPLPISTGGNGKADFSDLDIFNVAFTSYKPRVSVFNSAIVKKNSVNYPMQLVENYEEIAYKTLKDRAFREIGKTAIRLAVKKVSEYTLKNENETAGALLGIFNAITEGADTRNWQSLPGQIYYTRIPLNKGENLIKFSLDGLDSNTKEISVNGNGGIQFQKITTPNIQN